MGLLLPAFSQVMTIDEWGTAREEHALYGECWLALCLCECGKRKERRRGIFLFITQALGFLFLANSPRPKL